MTYINAREYCELNNITEDDLGIVGEVTDMQEIEILAEEYLKQNKIDWRKDEN